MSQFYKDWQYANAWKGYHNAKSTVKSLAPSNQRFGQLSHNNQAKAAQARENKTYYWQQMGKPSNSGHSYMSEKWSQQAFGPRRGGKTRKGKKSKRSPEELVESNTITCSYLNHYESFK